MLTEHRAEPTVVAVVGLAGSGKSTAAQILESLGLSRVYFGGVVLAEVGRRNLAPTQESERTVRESLREELGMAAIATLAAAPISEALDRGDHVVVDGLYSEDESKFLESNFNLAHLAIHSSLPTRVRRMASRHTRSLDMEKLLARDEHELTHLDKAKPIAKAEFHIVNDADTDSLRVQLTSLLPEILQLRNGLLGQ